MHGDSTPVAEFVRIRDVEGNRAYTDGMSVPENNIATEEDVLLVTGATGLVGSHVAERARRLGMRVRALVRPGTGAQQLEHWGVERAEGELTDPASLVAAAQGATLVVHCAAKVGDWGNVDDYRAVNVRGLEHLLNAVEAAGTLRHFVHVSSLGVYEGRDHRGTDESVEPSRTGLDPYTLTKIEAEQRVLWHIARHELPATIVRPGFIYGPRDRSVLPRLLARLKARQVKYFGSGEQLMNNTFVGNLVDAIFAVLKRPQTIGEIFNVTDGKLVSKREFISQVASLAGYPAPRGAVPLWVARLATTLSERVYRALGAKEAPLLNNARYKFLGLHLEFSIDKARRVLGYDPRVAFPEAMQQTIDWFRAEGRL